MYTCWIFLEHILDFIIYILELAKTTSNLFQSHVEDKGSWQVGHLPNHTSTSQRDHNMEHFSRKDFGFPPTKVMFTGHFRMIPSTSTTRISNGWRRLQTLSMSLMDLLILYNNRYLLINQPKLVKAFWVAKFHKNPRTS